MAYGGFQGLNRAHMMPRETPVSRTAVRLIGVVFPDRSADSLCSYESTYGYKKKRKKTMDLMTAFSRGYLTSVL